MAQGLSLYLSQLTRLTQVCKPWRRELEARGFCNKTVRLCSVLAEGGDAERLGQTALRCLTGSTSQDANAFLQKMHGGKHDLHGWIQAASQEPDASFLSQGAASTAQSLGMALVEWVGKPQGRDPELYNKSCHSDGVYAVACSLDGTRVVTGSKDTLVKIWDAKTGAQVRILECVQGEWRGDWVVCAGVLQQHWSGKVCALSKHAMRDVRRG